MQSQSYITKSIGVMADAACQATKWDVPGRGGSGMNSNIDSNAALVMVAASLDTLTSCCMASSRSHTSVSFRTRLQGGYDPVKESGTQQTM